MNARMTNHLVINFRFSDDRIRYYIRVARKTRITICTTQRYATVFTRPISFPKTCKTNITDPLPAIYWPGKKRTVAFVGNKLCYALGFIYSVFDFRALLSVNNAALYTICCYLEYSNAVEIRVIDKNNSSMVFASSRADGKMALIPAVFLNPDNDNDKDTIQNTGYTQNDSIKLPTIY